ncbi:hypothetical protein [Streptomyces platensis]|uniref:hypothetical protein n=1 Tax=Streptomyces platensis TaxID=58346 RepID=UPI002E26273C
MATIYATEFETGRALGMEHGEAAEYADGIAKRAVCRYNARHQADGVKATEVLDCGRIGKVHACEECREFYQRMK